MFIHLRVQMVAPDDGIGTLQVLGGSPSHPVTVGTTLTHADKSLQPPQGWRVCGRSSAYCAPLLFSMCCLLIAR